MEVSDQFHAPDTLPTG